MELELLETDLPDVQEIRKVLTIGLSEYGSLEMIINFAGNNKIYKRKRGIGFS